MAILGLRGTGDFGANERPENFREYILWRNPNGSAPLTALLGKAKSESTDDPTIHWFEEENTHVRLSLNNAATIAATVTALTPVVAGGVTTNPVGTATQDGTNLVPGDLLMVEAAATADPFATEILMVSAVTSATSITVTRGAAGTTAAVLPIGCRLLKIGNVYAEGSVSPSVSTRNPNELTNQCQIFKTAYELTNTVKQTRLRTGDALSNDKKRKMFDHSAAIEQALMFGRASVGVGTNGKPMRTMAGLGSFLTSHKTIFTVAPTLTTFLNAVTPVFDFDSGAGNERLVLCGNGALTSLNKLAAAQGQVKFVDTVKLYGMDLQRWVMPQGTLYFRTHPLMNVHSTYTNAMFVIDPSALVWRPLRDTRSMDNIQANDADTQKGQWLTEATLEVRHEKTMAYLGNFIV